jgi:hypothetical protein
MADAWAAPALMRSAPLFGERVLMSVSHGWPACSARRRSCWCCGSRRNWLRLRTVHVRCACHRWAIHVWCRRLHRGRGAVLDRRGTRSPDRTRPCYAQRVDCCDYSSGDRWPLPRGGFDSTCTAGNVVWWAECVAASGRCAADSFTTLIRRPIVDCVVGQPPRNRTENPQTKSSTGHCPPDAALSGRFTCHEHRQRLPCVIS